MDVGAVHELSRIAEQQDGVALRQQLAGLADPGDDRIIEPGRVDDVEVGNAFAASDRNALDPRRQIAFSADEAVKLFVQVVDRHGPDVRGRMIHIHERPAAPGGHLHELMTGLEPSLGIASLLFRFPILVGVLLYLLPLVPTVIVDLDLCLTGAELVAADDMGQGRRHRGSGLRQHLATVKQQQVEQGRLSRLDLSYDAEP